MKPCFALLVLMLPAALLAADIINQSASASGYASSQIKTAVSPLNRVAVLELYTSEGCSSCPPADRFLSSLKQAGISDKQLIPMAFHVTYWDYIGWSDRFASKRYDQRQRDLAHKNRQSTVYTPQFILSGDDFRRYSSFSKDVNNIVREKSSVDIALSMITRTKDQQDTMMLKIESDISRNGSEDVAVYLVILEDDLSSDVNDGENEGEILVHDYVVRRLLGPYDNFGDDLKMKLERMVLLPPEWKKGDISIVAFAEDSNSGEVLQAVRLDY